MTTASRSQTVDLGHGRGRLLPEAAASVWRIDAQLGRPADINSAWRDPILQQKLYDAWEAYRKGYGPKAPLALPPDKSVHCKGTAADSDDWYQTRAASIWYENGWRQTARYPGNKDRDEPWHGEYFARYDNFYGQTSGGNAKPLPVEDDMSAAEVEAIKAHVSEQADQTRRTAAGTPGAGAWLVRYAKSEATGTVFALYANALGGKYRTAVTRPDELAALGDVYVHPQAYVQAYVQDVADDGVAFHPGVLEGYGASEATGNVFALYVDSRGNRSRRLVTPVAGLDAPKMPQPALWAYAPINQPDD